MVLGALWVWGCGNNDAFRRNAGGFGREFFRAIAYVSRNHATIHHGKCDAYVSSLEDEASGFEVAGIHLSASALGKPSVE